MKTPLFSIIIPVYGVEPYLCKCLDSVVNQTFDDWECICVDDGSPTIAERYWMNTRRALRDATFRGHSPTNGGVSVARNMALDVAKGEWVQFLIPMIPEIGFSGKLAADIQKHPDVDAVSTPRFIAKKMVPSLWYLLWKVST